MASSNAATVESRSAESYVDTGNEKSIEITLSGTPGEITVVTLPDTAKGFKLYPRTNGVRFSVNNTSPAAVATSSTTPIAASALAVGGIAKPDMWETRLLPNGTARTLSLRSATASVVVDLEVY